MSSSDNLYIITTERYGDIQLEAESAPEARRRAREMFPGETIAVHRARSYRHCERCDSAPCTCPPRQHATVCITLAIEGDGILVADEDDEQIIAELVEAHNDTG